MFDNIGEKIKVLAKVVAGLGIAVSVILGIYYMTAGREFFGYGLTIAIVGSLGSWISSFFAYGFGELIVNSEIIKKNVESIDSYNNEIVNKVNDSLSEKKKAANQKIEKEDNEELLSKFDNN